MNGYLKQATAGQSRLIGPFVDDTDGKTLKTGLTINNTDVKLRANGTTLANKNSGGGTHQVNGEYSVTWDATDTANVGELKYSVSVTGALVVTGTYVVVEEVVYDGLFGASAPGYLQPTVAGRTLDVSAGGEAGVDWANVGTPGSAVNLSATTTNVVNTATAVTTVNGLANNVITANSINADAITAAKVADGTIDAATFAAGAINAAAIAADAITAAKIADGAIDANTFAANALDAVWSAVIENSKTALQCVRLIKAACMGKLSGAATTTVVLRDEADTKDRIVATVDSQGNRSAVALDAS